MCGWWIWKKENQHIQTINNLWIDRSLNRPFQTVLWVTLNVDCSHQSEWFNSDIMADINRINTASHENMVFISFWTVSLIGNEHLVFDLKKSVGWTKYHTPKIQLIFIIYTGCQRKLNVHNIHILLFCFSPFSMLYCSMQLDNLFIWMLYTKHDNLLCIRKICLYMRNAKKPDPPPHVHL